MRPDGSSPTPPKNQVAVLMSGGLDSAVLAGDLLREGCVVHPLYVRCGHRWESAELACLRRFLEALRGPELRPLVVLKLPMDDLLPDHWSMTHGEVPDADSPDEAVYLPARNVLLLAKGMLWCHLHGVGDLAIGTLGGNPFPDATPGFFDDFGEVVSRGINGSVRVSRPFASLSKVEVLRRGDGLPMERTLSCLRPVGDRHCGECNKCAERRRAFAEAGLVDHTAYGLAPSQVV